MIAFGAVLLLQYLEWREKQYDVRELVNVYGHADQLQMLQPISSATSTPQAPQGACAHHGASTTGSSTGTDVSTSGSEGDGEHALLLQGVLCYIASSDVRWVHHCRWGCLQHYKQQGGKAA